uniref:Uncharacterized protein n=1 Tax=Neobodo designis TaxID=312471 RepID=A0A7S1LCJ2_NEODS|mmetsp:Transcript_19176/g.59561  ORF Transcript_19176/g.59561 Transcript_19176/m.59561 type:complete len:236 (+) Transcript_19176:3-710(+)
MAGYIMGAPAASIIAAFLTMYVQIEMSQAIAPGQGTTGYLRGGAILAMMTSFFMPLITLSEKVEIAEDVEVYFQGDNKTPMWLCMLLGACGVLFWDDSTLQYHILWTPTLLLGFFLFCAASTGDVNLYKLVGYNLLHLLTMPFMWPPDRTNFNPSAPTIAFVIVAWAAAAYVNFAYPGAPFDAFHEAEHVEMIEAQTAFIDGKSGADTDESSVAKMYKAGDSGASPEKGGSITED